MTNPDPSSPQPGSFGRPPGQPYQGQQPPPGYGPPPQPYGQPQFGQPGFGQPPPQYGHPQPAFGQPGPQFQQLPHQPGPPEPQSGPASPGGIAQWLIAVTALLVFIGAFLPWATLGPFSVSGIGGEGDGAKDGVITLVAAVIAALLAGAAAFAGGTLRMVSGIVAVLLGLVILAVAVIDIVDIQDSGVNVGSGLWLTLVGGVLMFVAAIAALVVRR